jgi:uncharacterized membrane-anchored protein
MSLRPSPGRLLIAVLIPLALLSAPLAARQQGGSVRDLNWMKGPKKVSMFSVATLDLPEGYILLDPGEASKFMALTHNIGSGDQYVVAPADFHWWSEIRYISEGHVKDDEKIDSGAILNTITEGTKAANVERRKNGWTTLSVVGWRLPPSYNTETKRLEWAIRGRDDSDNSETINFNTRVLGRTGVTSATLMVEPTEFDGGVSEFKNMIGTYAYTQGQRYYEFRSGDKIAEYGLTALVVGGAAAVAAKTGFWKVLAGVLAASWKFIIAGVAALLAGVRQMFKRKDS